MTKTSARQRAVQDYLDNLWLDQEMINALMVWVGINPDSSVYAFKINRAIWAAASTAREYKTNHRNTMFAREMYFKHRLGSGERKYKKPVIINASSVLRVINNPKYIGYTIKHVPERRKQVSSRRYDMEYTGKFFGMVVSKFLRSHVWAEEYLTVSMFGALDLMPNELLDVRRSYDRLSRIVVRAGADPELSKRLGFTRRYPTKIAYDRWEHSRHRNRCSLLKVGDFIEVMNLLFFFDDRSYAAIDESGLHWSSEDQSRLFEVARRLRRRLI